MADFTRARVTQHKLEGAIDHLRNTVGIDITAAPEPDVRGMYDIRWGSGRFDERKPERLTAREVYFLARGARVGAAAEHQRVLDES